MAAAVWIAIVLLFVPAAARAQLADCSMVGQTLFVRDLFDDVYYWYEHIPDVDAAAFNSPEEYLEAIRYRPLDRGFSHISSKVETDAFYSDSQFIGFGFSTRARAVMDGGALEMRVSEVFEASPAAHSVLQRGDVFVSIDGRTINDWWRAGELGNAFGPSEIGHETTIVYRRGTEHVEVRLTKQLVTIPTVSTTRLYDVRGVKVGYIFFRNFVQPSMSALDAAFAQFQEAGVRELVLDLRYNGGGLVSVAQRLASLVGGARTEGLVLGEYAYNDKNTFRNQTLRFDRPPQALMLDRLIVITSRSTASASELVINGLKPFIPVVVIGDRTFGKPVGQNRIDFCEKSAFPVTFTIRNANGEADYFDGIPAACSATDDLDRQIGDATEASLAQALKFVETGACNALPGSRVGPSLAQPLTIDETGFRQLIGAW